MNINFIKLQSVKSRPCKTPETRMNAAHLG